MAKVLIVDDDEAVVQSLTQWLTAEEHHTVEALFNGRDAVEFLSTYSFDVVVLDWEMPHKSGIDVCKYLRDNHKSTPVIMLTGRTTTSNKTEGLDAGADDYLTKPFEPKELSARIRALLRRHDVGEPGVTHRDVEIKPTSREVRIKGKFQKVQPADFDLFLFLVKQPGVPFSAEALLSRVWTDAKSPTVPGLRMSVKRLRQLLAAAESELVIETVGDGYMVLR